MTSDLYSEALRRIRTSPQPDWKTEMQELYDAWSACDDYDEQKRLEDEMVVAFLPLLAHVAYRYHNEAAGFTRRDAFEVGLARFPYALQMFKPERSPRGTRAFSSWMINAAERAMCAALRKALTRRDIALVVSLDTSTNLPKRLMSADDDALRHVGQPGVEEVVEETIGEMSEMDALAARMILLRGATRQQVLDAFAERGREATLQSLRDRYHGYILPKLRWALVAAGYER